MDFSLIELIKFIGTIIAIMFTALKLKSLLKSIADQRSEYEFAKKFFEVLANEENKPNKFVQAIGYRALAGIKHGDENAIKFIVSLDEDNAVDKLYDYRKAWSFIKFDIDSQTFSYKGWLRSELIRRMYKGAMFLTYLISALAVCSPFIAFSYLPHEHFGLAIFISLLSLIVAAISLVEVWSIDAANRLINSPQKPILTVNNSET